MSKVNVDEIKVGDLIGYGTQIGLVTKIVDQKVWAYWNDYKGRELHCNTWEITAHWKVINFEEEKQMDELKVYTGEETLKALMERKILSWATDQYKLDGEFLYEKNGNNEWRKSYRSLAHFINNEFTEVVTPQVGDWVRVTHTYSYGGETRTTIHTAKLTDVKGELMWAQWDNTNNPGYYRFTSEDIAWEVLSPEQVSEYKREQAFVKVGRKPNEYKRGDIVYIDSVCRVAIVASNNNTSVINLHGINEEGKGYTAKPHQLTPISFIEDQVSLD